MESNEQILKKMKELLKEIGITEEEFKYYDELTTQEKLNVLKRLINFTESEEE